MRILAVDPGLTIGLAFYDSEQSHMLQVTQVEDAWMAEEWIYNSPLSDVFLVEDYYSSGHLSREANITIRRLGRIHGYLYRDFEAPVYLVAPQARLSAVEEATEMIGESANTMHRKGRDAIAALAHCIAWAREHSDT